ncbi:hypothetical protein Bbelb_217310 [Branchiostoma belcheri]|nr:hypothetical protein Bbelb_217310 [Branchiostoma belcheri]
MSAASGDVPVAIVTGSSQRLGACTVKHLHQAGYNVIIHYRKSQAQAEEFAQSLNRVRPDSAVTLQADFSKGDTEKMAKELIGAAAQKWGRLDVLVNNASDFFPTPWGQWMETSGRQSWAVTSRHLSSCLRRPSPISKPPKAALSTWLTSMDSAP